MRWLYVLALAASSLAGPSAGADVEPGSIKGVVTSAHDGSPVRGAFIRIRGPEKEYNGRANGEGRFVVDEIPPGNYSVSAEKPSFARTRGHQTPVIVRPGEAVTADLEMLGWSVVAGTVIQADGQPAQSRTVAAYTVEFRGSERHLTTRTDTTTDDRGYFRFVNLSEQPIVIRAEGAAAGVTDATRKTVPASAFYPAAAGPATAQVIRPKAGTTLEGIDIRLSRAPNSATRVLAEDLGNQGCRGCRIQIVRHDGSASYTAYQTSLDVANYVDVFGLEPGLYTALLHGVGQTRGGVSGEAELIVTEGEPATTTVSMQPPVRIAGRIEFDGLARSEPIRRRRGGIVLLHTAPWRQARGGRRQVRWDPETGKFEAYLPARGEYTLAVEGLDGGYLRSISAGGRKLSAPTLGIGPSGLTDLVLDYAWDTGTVTAELDTQKAAMEVVLWPVDRTSPDRGSLPRARVISDVALVRDVPPGEYFAYAAAVERRIDLDDPAIRAQYRSRLEAIVVRPGESTRVRLSPLPNGD